MPLVLPTLCRGGGETEPWSSVDIARVPPEELRPQLSSGCGHGRPSRAPLAQGWLYHAVRRGPAVTEPCCCLSTHLMSELLRCRQPQRAGIGSGTATARPRRCSGPA